MNRLQGSDNLTIGEAILIVSSLLGLMTIVVIVFRL